MIQETVVAEPGFCLRVAREDGDVTKRAILHYQLPIHGHVAMWLEDPRSIRGEQGVKDNWQIPVRTLLEVAKVLHHMENDNDFLMMRLHFAGLLYGRSLCIALRPSKMRLALYLVQSHIRPSKPHRWYKESATLFQSFTRGSPVNPDSSNDLKTWLLSSANHLDTALSNWEKHGLWIEQLQETASILWLRNACLHRR